MNKYDKESWVITAFARDRTERPIHNSGLALRRKGLRGLRLTVKCRWLELCTSDSFLRRGSSRPVGPGRWEGLVQSDRSEESELMKKCRRCSKPSTLHITEIREGVVHELHLCESCAQEYLNNPVADIESGGEAEETGEFSMKLEEHELDELDQIVCPNCGITFREFRSQGRLGCPHDYIAFEAELLPLLENIHGEMQHCGKFPKRAPDASRRQFSLIRLRNELRTAVDEENYEAAARLRDEIRGVETELGLSPSDTTDD